MKYLSALTGRFERAAPIGIDFGAERLNMLQVKSGPGGPLVRAAASVPYPSDRNELLADPRRLRRFMREALRQAPFAGRRVVAALAPSDVRILPLTVQVPAGQSEQLAVARQVREQLGAQSDEAVVDYIQVRSADAAGPERQVLAAVAPAHKVASFLDALRGARLEPVALDIGPAAMARLLAAMHEVDYEQPVILVHFGGSRSYLTVTWGRRLLLNREIDFGENQLVDNLAKALGLSPQVALTLLREHGTGEPQAQPGPPDPRDMGRAIREILHPQFAALAEELARTQVYVASRTRGSAVRRVYLHGSAARYAHVPRRIADLARLPVDVLDPFQAFRPAPGFTPGANLANGIALAAGLALRGRKQWRTST